MVSKRMPRYGRASGWPADAWAMSGRAMSIGMAKPMPCASPATAVLMPMTLPLGVEQRAAAVAGVDRGVGLDEVGRGLGRRLDR